MVRDEIVNILDGYARDVVELLIEADETDAVVIYACRDGSYEVLSVDGISEETVAKGED